jgi:hypothetical protein
MIAEKTKSALNRTLVRKCLLNDKPNIETTAGIPFLQSQIIRREVRIVPKTPIAKPTKP